MTLFPRWPKLLASSVDPDKLSMTIRGVLTAVIPLVLTLAPMFNWTVSADDFQNLTNGLDGFFKALEALIVVVTTLVSAYWTVWGAIRRIAVGLGWYK